MGTREYLESLNLDQLEYARNMADELIAEKRKERQLVVWRVERERGLIELFAEADYVKAAERLLEEARVNAASPEPLSPKRRALHLTPEFVPESEYAELGLTPKARSSGPYPEYPEDQSESAQRPGPSSASDGAQEIEQ